MKTWEDIFKERLEGYESPLPEGSFAEFRARRDSSPTEAPVPQRASSAKGTPAKRLWPLWMATAAAAAAVVLLLVPGHKVSTSVTPGMPISETSTTADAEEVHETGHPVVTTEANLEPIRPETTAQSVPELQHSEATTQAKTQAQRATATRGESKPHQPSVINENPDTAWGREQVPDEESSHPDTTNAARGTLHESKPGSATNGYSGQLWIAGEDNHRPNPEPKANLGKIIEKGYLAGSAAALATVLVASGGIGIGGAGMPSQLPDGAVTPPSHHFPSMIGLSTSLPVSRKWHFVTGIEYDMYHSTLFDQNNVKIQQYAHYLSIPMRMDWTAYSFKRLDLYVGGGLEGNFCVSATRDNNELEYIDAPTVTLLGVGGLQFRITDNLGFYVEPGVNLSIPSVNQPLSTYRTEHPLSFSLSTGLRVIINRLH